MAVVAGRWAGERRRCGVRLPQRGPQDTGHGRTCREHQQFHLVGVEKWVLRGMGQGGVKRIGGGRWSGRGRCPRCGAARALYVDIGELTAEVVP